jgi:hypothetical protein
MKRTNTTTVGKGRVEYSNAFAGGKLQVNLVGSNTKGANANEVLGLLQHFCSKLRLATNSNGVYILNLFLKSLQRQSFRVIFNFKSSRLEQIDCRLIYILQQ